MGSQVKAALSLLLLYVTSCFAAITSPRRGLTYIGRGGSDDQYWTSPQNGLTWYYNYGFYQTPSMANSGQQFVPMLWGAPGAGAQGDFLKMIKQYKNSGMNVSHVLGFNEPDHPMDSGGSQIPLADAVRIWKSEMEPIRQLGVKLGSPATVGNPGGIKWLQDFIAACDGCHFDFIPLHYYGPFDGMMGHIALAKETFENVTSEFWLTEFALQAAPLEPTQRAFNQSLDWLDGANNTNIARYTYFGSFRTDHGNTWVGPNVAFVDTKGQLTDMGSWYLGDKPSSAFTTTSNAIELSSSSLGAWTSVLFASFMSIYR